LVDVMPNITIQKAENLSAAVRSALESLLGRPLEAAEEISIMALRPHEAPQGHERNELAQQLKRQMDKMSQRAQGASDEELDAILDEGMSSVRPSYRPLK
jgi:hypothetical protein